MTVAAALEAFATEREAILDDMKTFIRMETISAQPEHAEDMCRCATWLRDRFEAVGLSAEVLATAKHPAVFADSGPAPSADAPTFLVYGHYDVQPTGDLALWDSPPFEPAIRDNTLYARGSADDKGQIMIHLAALRAWHKANGPLPVRIKVLIEGEEEIGSENLPALVEAERDRLACDYVLISDTSKHSEDVPALTCSTRGLVYKEIAVSGPSRDLHSGQYGGAIANPANVLAEIIASLHDHDGRVTIPGFYDDVQPVSDDQRQRLDEHGIDDAQLIASTGSPGPAGEHGYSSRARCTLRPSLDVNGLVSGYIADGAATIIPSRASAKVSMRLVADQDPAHISEAFDQAVRHACPDTVRLDITTHGTCGAYAAPEDSPAMRAACDALLAGYGHAPVLAYEGGTLPILPLFKSVLKADSVMMGFAVPDCNLHSPNEFFRLRDFEIGTACILHFLAAMGQQSS